jgi:hypothetical protein
MVESLLPVHDSGPLIDPYDEPYVEFVFCYRSHCSLLVKFGLILDYLMDAGIISAGGGTEEISTDERKRKASPTMMKNEFDTEVKSDYTRQLEVYPWPPVTKVSGKSCKIKTESNVEPESSTIWVSAKQKT